MKDSLKISDAEWEVMTVLWEAAPLAAIEIVERVSLKKKWASRTIRTLIDRLVKKAAIVRIEGAKRSSVYRPKVTMTECIRKESETFVQRIFGGEPASMLLHMVKETDLTPEQIRQLRKLLSQKEK